MGTHGRGTCRSELPSIGLGDEMTLIGQNRSSGVVSRLDVEEGDLHVGLLGAHAQWSLSGQLA